MRRLADVETLRRFMRELARAARGQARVYFTGGATAVLLGWRPTTIDVDLTWEPERDELFRALPGLKERLQINVEIAAPPHFIPELPGWRERCLPIVEDRPLRFLHYDPYAQTLAKIERGHAQDRLDVAAMIERGLVERGELARLFRAIVPDLYRYPAVDPEAFGRAVGAAADAPG